MVAEETKDINFVSMHSYVFTNYDTFNKWFFFSQLLLAGDASCHCLTDHWDQENEQV